MSLHNDSRFSRSSTNDADGTPEHQRELPSPPEGRNGMLPPLTHKKKKKPKPTEEEETEPDVAANNNAPPPEEHYPDNGGGVKIDMWLRANFTVAGRLGEKQIWIVNSYNASNTLTISVSVDAAITLTILYHNYMLFCRRVLVVVSLQ